MIKKSSALLIILLIPISAAFSQFHAIISFFNGEAYNDQVLLTWNISGGNNCNGIIIYHSSDNISYTEIGEIPGLCGEIIDSEPYSFLHSNPNENQVNYYKLQLGSQGFTTPLEVLFYNTNDIGFTVFPNPSEEVVNIYINNAYQNASIEVFDMNGKQILINNYVSGVLNPIYIRDWESGTYLIRLLNDNNIIGTDRIIRL
jgi:hypothetical protein